jgi:hypothetical protein
MSGYCRWFLCFVLIVLAVDNVQGAMPFPHKLLSEVSQLGDEQETISPLQISLSEMERGLELSISFSATGEVPPGSLATDMVGGDYLVFLDEIIIINESYIGSSLNISKEIPLTTLQDGHHLLRCELRTPNGDIIKEEIQFLFDGSPVIEVTDVVVDETGILDPSLKMDFLGVENEIFGFIDVFLDEHPYSSAQVNPEHIGKQVPLSQIIGKPLSIASLAPGTHLLTLVIRGIGGSETMSYHSFTINASPSLKIMSGPNGSFQEAVAVFLKAPDGISGSVEVFLYHNIIFSKRDNETSISINRAELIDSIKKINPEYITTNVPLIFSLQAANGSEYWQKIDFQ